jgi:Ohr subfamily peroxiredoxin
MSEPSKIVHTAITRTTGARHHGISRSLDGRLDVRLAGADSDRIGTTPEHLFGAAWSACLETAIGMAARRRKMTLPPGLTIEAEVDLNVADSGYFLSARLNVSLPGVDRALARSLLEEAHRTCPYSKATRGNMDVLVKLIE